MFALALALVISWLADPADAAPRLQPVTVVSQKSFFLAVAETRSFFGLLSQDYAALATVNGSACMDEQGTRLSTLRFVVSCFSVQVNSEEARARAALEPREVSDEDRNGLRLAILRTMETQRYPNLVFVGAAAHPSNALRGSLEVKGQRVPVVLPVSLHPADETEVGSKDFWLAQSRLDLHSSQLGLHLPTIPVLFSFQEQIRIRVWLALKRGRGACLK